MAIRHWGASSVVTSTTVNNQRDPQVAAFANGTYVVAWEDDLGSGASAIKFQRFDAFGKKIGQETTVPSFDNNGDQTKPSIAVLSDGNFVIVNQDSDVGTNQVSISRYTDQGVLIGQSQGQFNGNAPTVTAYQGTFWVNYDYDDVGSTTAWGFIEVNNNGTIFNDNLGSIGSYSNLSAQTAGNLVPQVSALADNLTTNGNIHVWTLSNATTYSMSVNGAARDPRLFFVNDSFVLTFVDVDAGGNARGMISVYRLAGSSYTPVVVNNSSQLLGKEFVSDLEIVTGPDGSFFLMWKEASAFVPGDSEIHIRELAMTGPLRDNIEAVGPDLLVSNSSAGQHGVPSITKLADGRLLVTWAEASGVGDGNGSGVLQQILDPRDGLVEGSNDPALAETLVGNDLTNDQINGLGGNDTIYGLAGADVIYGGAGADDVEGGRGDDTLYGDADGDFLSGGVGDDEIYGGSGDDTIYMGSGEDYADGGTGFNTLSYFARTQGAIINMADQTLNAGSAIDDTFININRINGSNIGADTLSGDNDDNYLVGYGGIDTLNGNSGADTLRGGAGADILSGGAGADKFRYDAVTEGGDTISSFSSLDNFEFVRTAFGNLAGANVAATAFLSLSSGNTATTTAQRFIYDQATDTLWYDANGSASGGLARIATISADTTITHLDLLLV